MNLGSEELSLLLKIIELDPESFEDSVALIHLYFKTGQFDLATDEILRLLSVQPTNNYPYKLLGDVRSEQGMKEEAVTAYIRYLRDNLDDERTLWNLTRLQLDTKQFRPALETAWIVIDNYLKRGNLEEARDLLSFFQDKRCDDLSYQELLVKLLALVDMQEQFEENLNIFMESLKRAGADDRLQVLNMLRQESSSMKEIEKYLSPGIIELEESSDFEDDDFIDELPTEQN